MRTKKYKGGTHLGTSLNMVPTTYIGKNGTLISHTYPIRNQTLQEIPRVNGVPLNHINIDSNNTQLNEYNGKPVIAEPVNLQRGRIVEHLKSYNNPIPVITNSSLDTKDKNCMNDFLKKNMKRYLELIVILLKIRIGLLEHGFTVTYDNKNLKNLVKYYLFDIDNLIAYYIIFKNKGNFDYFNQNMEEIKTRIENIHDVSSEFLNFFNIHNSIINIMTLHSLKIDVKLYMNNMFDSLKLILQTLKDGTPCFKPFSKSLEYSISSLIHYDFNRLKDVGLKIYNPTKYIPLEYNLLFVDKSSCMYRYFFVSNETNLNDTTEKCIVNTTNNIGMSVIESNRPIKMYNLPSSMNIQNSYRTSLKKLFVSARLVKGLNNYRVKLKNIITRKRYIKNFKDELKKLEESIQPFINDNTILLYRATKTEGNLTCFIEEIANILDKNNKDIMTQMIFIVRSIIGQIGGVIQLFMMEVFRKSINDNLTKLEKIIPGHTLTLLIS